MSGWDDRGCWSLAVHGLEAALILARGVMPIVRQAIDKLPGHPPQA